ncbi:Uncharacterised protein [BD1-7 clade bacterium]|uniref:GTP-binding protein n=1 Tax=BD1-7 clade bacterium TaxID=2029982 RepID=A0A5S9MY09_9GAMM|nr:Uncharacterised protein [BD1-7 clade bacterium]
MNQHKILFSGPVGAGKTTAIRSLSDIDVVGTEADASDDVKKMKRHTTVAMDYGIIYLDNAIKVHLYGTPGQERFDFMWEILADGALGLILLIDASRDSAANDLIEYLKAFSDLIAKTAVAVGLTRCENNPAFGPRAANEILQKQGIKAPVFDVDARNRKDMSLLLKGLLFTLDPGAQDAE